MSIIGRFRECLELTKDKEFLGVNFGEDALFAYKIAYPQKSTEYVDSDLFSPLLYKFWGEFLLNKKVISSYSIEFTKHYRYILNACYGDNRWIKLGSDSLLSIRKSNITEIFKHRYSGGFMLWPSHSGGINFRRNRYGDDIFLTLDDIRLTLDNFDEYYENPKKYKGVIPQTDFEWFKYLERDAGGFFDIFFLNGYENFRDDLLGFENYRTEKMEKFLSGQ